MESFNPLAMLLVDQTIQSRENSEMTQEEMNNIELGYSNTQKGRGIQWLGPNNPFYYLGIETIPFTLIQKKDDIANIPAHSFPRFIRPCPVRPRHGFVDSRLCYSIEDAYAVWEEMIAEDPKGELIVMRPCYATWNAVWANGVLSFGPGNDGATSGNESVSIGMPKVGPTYLGIYAQLPHGLIAPGETSYFEFVGSPGEAYVTQARSGVVIERAGDYIPRDIEVKRIIRTNGETLTEWERIILSIREEDKPTTIVYHPGGNCGDHFFVHSAQAHIAITMGQREPIVGETWNRVDGFELNMTEFQAGYRAAWNPLPEDTTLDLIDIFRLSIIVLHSYGAQSDSKLVGWACGWFVRIGLTLCIGEARYSEMSGPIYKRMGRQYRGAIYDSLKFQGFRTLKGLIKRALYSFEFDNWGSGFGGKKWASSARRLLRLHNSAITGKDNVIAQWNTCVNLAHNGGWLFNKICSLTDLEYASKDPHRIALKHMNKLYYVTRAFLESMKEDSGAGSIKRKLEYYSGREGKVSFARNLYKYFQIQIETPSRFYPLGFDLHFKVKMRNKLSAIFERLNIGYDEYREAEMGTYRGAKYYGVTYRGKFYPMIPIQFVNFRLSK